jgi:hypothetical protein
MSIYDKTVIGIMLDDERWIDFSLTLGIIQGTPSSSFLFNFVPEDLVNTTKSEKEIRQTGKEKVKDHAYL